MIIFFIRFTIYIIINSGLMQMSIRPSHHNLNDFMKIRKFNVRVYKDPPPDQRLKIS